MDNYIIIKRDLSERKFNESVKMALENGYWTLYENCTD